MGREEGEGREASLRARASRTVCGLARFVCPSWIQRWRWRCRVESHAKGRPYSRGSQSKLEVELNRVGERKERNKRGEKHR